MDRDTGGDGILETTYFYHRDGLGSITVMTDSAGAVAQTYVYDGFGNIVDKTGSVVNTYTYTAREWDEEASIYYYRARFYSPEIGRFLQEDPEGFDAGINFYVYVLNNSINSIDPTGLCCECPSRIWSGAGLNFFGAAGTKIISQTGGTATCWDTGERIGVKITCTGTPGRDTAFGIGLSISTSGYVLIGCNKSDIEGQSKSIGGSWGLLIAGGGGDLSRGGGSASVGLGFGGYIGVLDCKVEVY